MDIKDLLNDAYRPLCEKAAEFEAALSKPYSGFNHSGGFFNRLYSKNYCALRMKDEYPIPIISVGWFCDIGIDFDCLTAVSKIEKRRAAVFDWSLFNNTSFEVFGAEDTLRSYGSDKNVDAIGRAVSGSAEKAFLVVFTLPFDTDGEGILWFVRKLQMNGFST